MGKENGNGKTKGKEKERPREREASPRHRSSADDEQLELRKELTRRLLALVPGPCLPVLGATPAARTQAIDAILDPLSSQECNAHLIVFILDLVLLTLFPEMGVAPSSTVPDAEGMRTPASLDSIAGTLTPPRPDSRPP